MLIYDENDILVEHPDLDIGKIMPDKMFKEHHPAIEAVEEVGHYEITAEYPNGGKDIAWIIDIPEVKAEESWDEYEDIYRYILYTQEELDAMEEAKNQPSPEERIAELEKKLNELTAVLSAYAVAIPELGQ